MTSIVRLVGDHGGIFASLENRLIRARFAVEQAGVGRPATLLVTLAQPAEQAIAAATVFFDRASIHGEDRLVVHIWRLAASADWPALLHAATMNAFTRHSARVWAAGHVRVNALTIAASTRSGDEAARGAAIADTIMALWRWRSMTGQIIDLGA